MGLEKLQEFERMSTKGKVALLLGKGIKGIGNEVMA